MSKKENKDAQEKTVDEFYVETKSKYLNQWFKENDLALQPILIYSEFGIRPSVRLIKTPSETNEQEK